MKDKKILEMHCIFAICEKRKKFLATQLSMIIKIKKMLQRLTFSK